MGYMRHHAIIVTGPTALLGHPGINDVWERCRQISAANELGGMPTLAHNLPITTPVMSPLNNYASFLVAPDGSKERWSPSNQGDRVRDLIIEYLDSLRYPDGSTNFRYVEVQYGDDEGETKIVRDSDEVRRTA